MMLLEKVMQQTGMFSGKVAAALAAMFLAACATTQTVSDATPGQAAREAAGAAVQQGQTVAGFDNSNYVLGPGDRIKVTVFGEPNLSGEFQLDSSGAIAMPLAGDIHVAGSDVRGLEKTITQKLSGRFLINPKVSAQVVSFRPYYVYGQVQQPGEFAFSTDLTVVNAIARAGGFTPRAKRNMVFIRRENETNEIKVPLNAELKVYPGDTVRIGARLF